MGGVPPYQEGSMRKKGRRKKTNTILLITAVIGVLVAAILIVSGIFYLTRKDHKPPENTQIPGRVTITKPLIAGEELLIKGCLFDLGIPKEHVRIVGRTMDITLPKALDTTRIEKVFSGLREVEGVEVSLKEPTQLTVMINEREWNIFFHVRKGPEKRLSQVAIIIDDMGMDMENARKLGAIDADITFSVLPQEKYTQEVGVYLHKHGKEVLLHLPMEGGNGKSPGLGAIFHDTDPAQAQKILEDSLGRVPMAIGVNNHMGSVVTQNELIMKALFSTINKHGLFFIDSLTSGNSVCRVVAAKEELPFKARDVFLDNDQTYQYIAGQLDELVLVAKHRGEAIGICHPHPATVEVLIKEVPRLKEKGIEVVRVSRLVDGGR
jgi:polysaccharide deacetylase 2 family uncharacterized protein YibQ